MSSGALPISPNALPACRHCGLACDGAALVTAVGVFCCKGCEAVYSVLEAQGLSDYYRCEVAPGPTQRRRGLLDPDRFAPLGEAEVAARVVEFDDGRLAVARFAVPDLHCASCIWLLEQLWRFDRGVGRTEVDLQRRSVRIEYRPAETSPRQLAEALSSLGYEPLIPAEAGLREASADRRLFLQLGLAGFAFGNSMLFSIPRYANGAALGDGLQRIFDGLNLALAVPVLLFSAADYFRGAWRAVRARTVAIEVPIALGLAVLFLRSVAEISSGRGPGFLDSFTGLVFFLLIGRLFQRRVFARIAFDRSYRSFLPLSVHVETAGGTAIVPIARLEPGDTVLLRRGEIVPADARLLDQPATVDYRFLTGEDRPVPAAPGDLVRAGGRAGGAMRLSVVREVSQSRLAALWANPVFGAPRQRWLAEVAPRFAGTFSAAAIGLAIAGAIVWWPDIGASASVATAVLIVACPCALTLAAPMTLGTAMTALGERGLYLREPAVVLDLSRVDTLVFDKTGTLTSPARRAVMEIGGLSPLGVARAARLAAESSHPVSRALATQHGAPELPRPTDVHEIEGQGLTGRIEGVRVAIGSASFIAGVAGRPTGPADRTYVLAGGELGWLRLAADARPGIEAATTTLGSRLDVSLLSGDNGHDSGRWSRLFGARTRFRQSPDDKLAYVEAAQRRGRHVLMIGDGLNDAGALAAADVGIAVSDDTACLVPACDAVMHGDRLADLPAVLRFAQRARTVLVTCLAVSLAYNAVGLTVALSGGLTPLASAILMPISSLTIVALSTLGTRWAASRVLPS